MIMARNEDGTYSQVGFVKDNAGIDTEYIYDKDGDIVFEKGFTRETSGTVPLTINGIGKDLKDWSITGNTVQNGTPTPNTPQEVKAVGDRTGNLFDGLLIGGLFTSADFNTSGNKDVYKSIKVFLPAGTYTFSFDKNVTIVRLIIDGNYSQPAHTEASSYTITSTTDGYVGISFRDTTSSSTVWDVTTPIMLNSGSTALPYEPYGYKIPITCAGVTTPVYLGQTQTVRRVKKLVLTGEEMWVKSGAYKGSFYAQIVTGILSETYTAFCSHLAFSTLSQYAKGKFCFNGGSTKNCNLWLNQFDSSTTVADFKSYLAAQYAAGTPVTVWYVLANDETAVVNEPLRKIGDYADILSMEQAEVQIPTLNGTTVIDVDTAVKPTEMYTKYKSSK